MLNLGPCSMLPPHYHPRASNYVVAVHGNTTTYMYEENGARLVTEVLTPGKATIFPQASMHMMVNNGKSATPSFFQSPLQYLHHRCHFVQPKASRGRFLCPITPKAKRRPPPFVLPHENTEHHPH